MSVPDHRGGRADEYDLEEGRSVFSRGLDVLVPGFLARWALSVRLETDKTEYGPNEPVEIRITIANRLPVPIEAPLTNQRVWGWTVDGTLEAIDEPLYTPDRPRTLALRAREVRTFDRRWDRQIKRTGSPPRWEPVPPGTYTISAFVSTAPPRTDSKTVTLR